MKKIIGVVLILLSLYLGYMGITMFTNSGESIDVVGIEISAQNNKKRSTSYMYMGGAVLVFIGGFLLVKGK